MSIFRLSCFVFLGLVLTVPAQSQVAIKVVFMAGQSNMQGYANAGSLPPTLKNPQTDILFYDGSGDSKTRNTLIPLQPNSTTSASYFGPEITFGRAMADAHPGTIYAIIKYGDSGKNLHTDFRAPYAGLPTGGAKYRSMMTTFNNGLLALSNAGYTPEIDGMLWLQGESDADTLEHAESYGENLTDFIGNMRLNFGADLPFVIGGIGYPSGSYRSTVIAEQIAVADALNNVAYFDNDDINGTVPYYHLLHFETPQMQTIGQRYATELQAIPEPTTMSLLGLGVLIVLIGQRGFKPRRLTKDSLVA